MACEFARRLDRDDDRFRGRRLAFVSDAAERDKWIGFAEICRGAAGRYRIRHDYEAIRVTPDVLEVACQIYDLARFQIVFRDVDFVHQDDPPLALDAAIAVAVVVNGGIELVMR